jgi:iron complex transport system substrate-binding protein
LGLGTFLKGVTHACIFPEEAKNKQKIIECTIDVNSLDSFEIDKKIKELYLNNEKLFVLNLEKLRIIRPDLIISQNVCEVCAPPFENEMMRIKEILGYMPKNLIINPNTLDEIINSIITIGQEIGNLEIAFIKANQLKSRIKCISDKVKEIKKFNRYDYKIICLEWMSPLYIAGHWIPDMVEIVGGSNGIGIKGSPSKVVSIDDIKLFDPDKIIIMPCGFDIYRTETEITALLKKDKKWKSLRAVQMNEIYVVDANSYFSKPNPRIVTGIEIMAKIIYPSSFLDLKVPKNSFKNFTINS